MEKYISKYALVAEIERLAEVKPIDEFQPQVQNKIDWLSGKLFAINSLRVFLDTLEVKDVDLEKEATEFVQTKEFVESKESPVLLIAKYFFELGLKAQKGENAKDERYVVGVTGKYTTTTK